MSGEETSADRNVEIWKIKKLIKSLEMARGWVNLKEITHIHYAFVNSTKIVLFSPCRVFRLWGYIRNESYYGRRVADCQRAVAVVRGSWCRVFSSDPLCCCYYPSISTRIDIEKLHDVVLDALLLVLQMFTCDCITWHILFESVRNGNDLV